MGRSPCCEKEHTNKGAWTKEEDERLISYIKTHGEGCWRSLPKSAGLQRCGKSCRLRWINYLRPDLKRGNFSQDEDEIIINLHSLLGNKWSLIAAKLPGRTDNEIKNYWNTHIKRKLLSRGIDPQTHRRLNSGTANTIDSVATTKTTISNKNTNYDASTSNTFQHIKAQGSTLQFCLGQERDFSTRNNDIYDTAAPVIEASSISQDSNSSSVLTGEDQDQINLELSICLPRPTLRMLNDDIKMQQQEYAYQMFGTPATTMTMFSNVESHVCLCYSLGFQNNGSCNCMWKTPQLRKE